MTDPLWRRRRMILSNPPPSFALSFLSGPHPRRIPERNPKRFRKHSIWRAGLQLDQNKWINSRVVDAKVNVCLVAKTQSKADVWIKRRLVFPNESTGLSAPDLAMTSASHSVCLRSLNDVSYKLLQPNLTASLPWLLKRTISWLQFELSWEGSSSSSSRRVLLRSVSALPDRIHQTSAPLMQKHQQHERKPETLQSLRGWKSWWWHLLWASNWALVLCYGIAGC